MHLQTRLLILRKLFEINITIFEKNKQCTPISTQLSMYNFRGLKVTTHDTIWSGRRIIL